MTAAAKKTKKTNEADGVFDGGWWEAEGPFRLLHAVNPLRLRALRETAGELAGKTLLDAGCGGGIFSEAAAAAGARVCGADVNKKAIAEAQARAKKNGANIEYRACETGALVGEGKSYDIAVCFEMLEHCESPAAVVADIGALLKLGGWAAFSTINRTAFASFLMIGVLEKLLAATPEGSHNAAQFVKPEELAGFCADAGLTVRRVAGLQYSFFGKHFYLDDSRFAANYFLFARRER